MHRDTIYSFHRSKRNKPCDSCRRQRRKCVPGEQDGRCTRCDQMHLQCTHEYVLTPTAADEAENAEEKARMVHVVAGIEQQMRRMEKEMTTVRVAAGLPGIYPVSSLERKWDSQYGARSRSRSRSPSNDSTITDYSIEDNCVSDESYNTGCPPSPTISTSSIETESHDNDKTSQKNSDSGSSGYITPAEPTSNSNLLERPTKRQAICKFKDNSADFERLNWTLTLRSGGLRIHTHIRTFQDLVNFALTNFDHMNSEDPHNPLSAPYLERHNEDGLTVTTSILTLGDSAVVVITNALSTQIPPTIDLSKSALNLENSLMNHLVSAYFACTNVILPFFYRPTFDRLFCDKQDPGSLAVVSSLAAFAASRHCNHVCGLGAHLLPIDLQLRASEHFARNARDYLGEVFDEPGFGPMTALCALAQYKFSSLDITQGWLYINMGLRMAEQIKLRYLRGGSHDLDDLAEREMFKRSFYYVLTTGLRFGLFGPTLDPKARTLKINYTLQEARKLGPPTPLPGEDPLPVLYYRQLLCLSDYQFDYRFTEMQRIRGDTSARVSVESCTYIEHALITWYNRLPPQLKLTPHLFQYLDASEIAQRDPYTINLAMGFYACWLSIHVHFLPPLREQDTADPPSKLALRSLTICVKSANIVTTLATYLHKHFPCKLDPHLLLHACDVHLKTSGANDVRLAAVGKRNLRECLRILKEAIGVGREVGLSRYWKEMGVMLRIELNKLGVRFF
ncbi:hypothetical protein BC937DRAFT_90421 [Endogone sp. FLAS-F59071]|nr:hypothetical protein BC937DRAFT_90421 [Endogone sp. FLAS-F59071]|eukprot:RUS22090.1 hypothetical protein BC937DRAFT_90421 [Endogone sp. FLAS-F59071]